MGHLGQTLLTTGQEHHGDMTGRRWVMAAILMLAVVLGAMREFLFLNLNYQIAHVRHGSAVSYAHSLFQGWVEGVGLDGLLRLKWILALIMAASMLGLSVLLARVLWGDHRYRLAIIAGFVIIGALALVCHLLVPAVPALHIVSVKLLHALQYPVLLFFLWAASLLRTPTHG